MDFIAAGDAKPNGFIAWIETVNGEPSVPHVIEAMKDMNARHLAAGDLDADGDADVSCAIN